MALEMRTGIYESYKMGVKPVDILRGKRAAVPFEGTLAIGNLSGLRMYTPYAIFDTVTRQSQNALEHTCYQVDFGTPAVLSTQVVSREAINKESQPWHGKVWWKRSDADDPTLTPVDVGPELAITR